MLGQMIPMIRGWSVGEFGRWPPRRGMHRPRRFLKGRFLGRLGVELTPLGRILRCRPRSLLQAFEQLYLAGVVHIVRCHAVTRKEVGRENDENRSP